MPDNPAPLFVAGLGPGSPDLLTPVAASVLRQAQCIAGYNLYMDLIAPELKVGKRLIASGMRQERERCQAAIRSALGGAATVIVSSGDPGIYAMASLVLELMGDAGLVDKIPFEVIPGVPAVCAAAACVGAPIGHDFACVSLSDLLTPKGIIAKRLHAAFMADFVCALYNPRSHGRPDCLAEAMSIAGQYRAPDCPVAICRKVGRPGQSALVLSLEQFVPEACDMLSIVIVGNSQSRQIGPYMLTPRGYNCLAM